MAVSWHAAPATAETVVEGAAEVDQAAPINDWSGNETAAAPAPVAATGSSGTVGRELWSAEETNLSGGLSVVTTSAAGTFAITGGVIDDSSGAPVLNASVALRNSATGATVVSATTDNRGTFAFVNVDPSLPYTLRVYKLGYGEYTLTGATYLPDESYESTVELGVGAQSYDLSTNAADGTQSASTAAVGGYDSHTRVPPWINVSMQPQTSECGSAGGTRTVRRYAWVFYILRTMAGEIQGSHYPGGYFDEHATKATMQAAQSFAWSHRTTGGGASGGGDVTNTNQYQCFRPEAPVRKKWRDWIADPVRERIAKADNQILLTQYRTGTYKCDGAGDDAPNSDVLSQLGAKKREESCGMRDWRALAHHYYTGTVREGLAPGRPVTSFTRSPCRVHFSFSSKIGTSFVGWRYVIERFVSDPSGTGWVEVYDRGWSAGQRTVPTTYAHSTTTTTRYRIKSWNPVGFSSYANVNNGYAVAPGEPTKTDPCPSA